MISVKGFSEEWDGIYKKDMQLTLWPWTDLISLFNQHCKDLIKPGGIVFELGCGAGPNIPFIKSLGMNYYGVDGSETIVNSLCKRYDDLNGKVKSVDFTKLNCFTEVPKVDVIIDRAAVTHNNLASIKKIINNSYNALEKGGIFIGVDWFSTKHSDYKLGKESGDKNTRIDIETGQFKNVGNVHFSNEDHLRYLFSSFDIIHLSEKIVINYEPESNHQFASWNIVVKKI